MDANLLIRGTAVLLLAVIAVVDVLWVVSFLERRYHPPTWWELVTSGVIALFVCVALAAAL